MDAGGSDAPLPPDRRGRVRFGELKTRLRKEAAEEARQADQFEAELEERAGVWKRRALWLGIAFAASAGGVVLFSDLGPWHGLWDMAGKKAASRREGDSSEIRSSG